MFSSSLNIGYTTEMLGFHAFMRTILDLLLKPAIDCFAVDYTFNAISTKIVAKHRVACHGMFRPEMVNRGGVDDEHRGMRFPICLKHRPSSRNYAFPSISDRTGSAGVGAHQMRATHETRCHAPVGKTVKLGRTSPDKNAIVWSRLLRDLPNSGEEIERLRSQNKGNKEKTCHWKHGCSDDGCSDQLPTLLRRTLL